MWTCKICEAEIDDDSWTRCWRCSGDKNPAPETVAPLLAAYETKANRGVDCIRCSQRMVYAGTQAVEDRPNMEPFFPMKFFRRLGFRLGDRPPEFDLYLCESCGKAEFFVDGIGDEDRGELD